MEVAVYKVVEALVVSVHDYTLKERPTASRNTKSGCIYVHHMEVFGIRAHGARIILTKQCRSSSSLRGTTTYLYPVAN
jgi:hypothetical protein